MAVGSPAPGLFMAMLEALVKMEVGALNRDKLKAYVDEVSALEEPPAEVAEIVVCRVERVAGDEAKRKLTVSMKGHALRTTVVSALVQTGADHKMGQAPPGRLEQELSEWAEVLASGGGGRRCSVSAHALSC